VTLLGLAPAVRGPGGRGQGDDEHRSERTVVRERGAQKSTRAFGRSGPMKRQA